GGEKRDARLIRERREIVHAGEAHDPPPLGHVSGARVRPDGVDRPFEEPVGEALLDREGTLSVGHWRRVYATASAARTDRFGLQIAVFRMELRAAMLSRKTPQQADFGDLLERELEEGV